MTWVSMLKLAAGRLVLIINYQQGVNIVYRIRLVWKQYMHMDTQLLSTHRGLLPAGFRVRRAIYRHWLQEKKYSACTAACFIGGMTRRHLHLSWIIKRISLYIFLQPHHIRAYKCNRFASSIDEFKLLTYLNKKKVTPAKK